MKDGSIAENVYYCCRYMAIMYSPIATDVFKNYLCGVNISCKDNRRMPIIFYYCPLNHNKSSPTS